MTFPAALAAVSMSAARLASWTPRAEAAARSSSVDLPGARHVQAAPRHLVAIASSTGGPTALLELFAKMIKQREESQKIYAEAGRGELAQQESEEIAIIREQNGECDVSAAVSLIKSSTGIARAEELATRYIHKALEALDRLPNKRTKKNLRDIAHFVTKRSY